MQAPLSPPPGLPKRIWLFWDRGWGEAPPLVKACALSWQQRNPGWQFCLLSDQNLSAYIPPPDVPPAVFSGLPMQKKANLIRLQLLLTYGGVWVDATCLCLQPLDAWLPPLIGEGLFLFSNPTPDRILSNWFIAAQKDHPLIRAVYQSRCAYWTRYPYRHPGPLGRRLKGYLSRVLGKNPARTRFWFHPLLTRVLRLSPYPIFHYDVYRLLREDPVLRQCWEGMPKVSAVEPHLVQRIGMLCTMTAGIQDRLERADVPLYKLSHKFEAGRLLPDTVLYRLLVQVLGMEDFHRVVCPKTPQPAP